MSGARSPARQAHARPWHFYWLCALILSFAYEKPIALLTPYDKTNPRLFHLVLLVGIVLHLTHRTPRPRIPRPFVTWQRIVIWFCICSVTWTLLILPWEYGIFSLYGAGLYVVGLIAIRLAVTVELDERQKRMLMYLAVAGGVFAAVYCIPEYLQGGTSRMLTEDKEIVVAEGTLLGPLGSTYFHLVQYQTLAFCIACGLIGIARTTRGRLATGAIALFICWPLFACAFRHAGQLRLPAWLTRVSGVAAYATYGVFLFHRSVWSALSGVWRTISIPQFLFVAGIGTALTWLLAYAAQASYDRVVRRTPA